MFLQEKGNCPLHVAAAAAQASQVELLLIYGADPGAYDSNGKTPIDHARYSIFNENPTKTFVVNDWKEYLHLSFLDYFQN